MSVWIIMLFVVLIVSYPLAWRQRPGRQDARKSSRPDSRYLNSGSNSSSFLVATPPGSRRVGACPDA